MEQVTKGIPVPYTYTLTKARLHEEAGRFAVLAELLKEPGVDTQPGGGVGRLPEHQPHAHISNRWSEGTENRPSSANHRTKAKTSLVTQSVEEQEPPLSKFSRS